MVKSIYLAGPIAGLTYDEAQDWRLTFSEWMRRYSSGRIECYSPLRGKSELRSRDALNCYGYDHVSPLATPKAIMARDFMDCSTADLVVANLAGQKVGAVISIGTVMEIAFAYAKRVPVLAIVPPESDSISEHAMMQEAINFYAPDTEDAALMATHILLP